MASRGGGLGERVAEATASFFEAVGVRVGTRPWLTIGLAFLVVLAGAKNTKKHDTQNTLQVKHSDVGQLALYRLFWG